MKPDSYHRAGEYRADRGRRTLRGIDEQVAKAEKAVAGRVPVKRNRFTRLAGGEKSVNRAFEAKARGLAGLKGYTARHYRTIQIRAGQHILTAEDRYHSTYATPRAHQVTRRCALSGAH
jgi:hypothetical protein